MYDIVFISYQELNADENYKNLIDRFPTAKRIHGVTGIHKAHVEAARISLTKMFWVVDGDSKILDDFNFDYKVEEKYLEHVHVWRSINPINGLVYGFGGIKLLPRDLTLYMDLTKPDMTTSISRHFIPVQQLSNITAFNTDPYNTWKSAFRECVKLSSKVIDRQKSKETEERLHAWCTLGVDKPFGEYSIRGAQAGCQYGTENKGDIEALKKINDFSWLKEQFDAIEGFIR
jgi:hypothetical protein